MPERSVEEIAAAQLNHDVAEAKQAFSQVVTNLRGGSVFNVPALVDAIENLIGKVVMRWWFARACKNRLAVETVDQSDVEARRKVRATKYVAMTQIVNAKTNDGKPPTALDLQMGMLDLIGNLNAVWQALFDAGIIHPNVKQDYLDAGCDELYERIVGYSQKIDLGKSAGGNRKRGH